MASEYPGLRVVASSPADAGAGTVRWSASNSCWIGGMTAIGVIGAPLTMSIGAVSIFIITTVITLCAGHSVGMHRRLIHKSYECPKWLEYVLVYLGVLVGMSGPFGMMRQHDLRDWAQRQPKCHPYLRHGKDILTDYWWQCHCKFDLPEGLNIDLGKDGQDPVYCWMERYWMLQQLPIALILFLFGGWSFVIWGVCLRVAVGVTGHWLVGYYAHHDQEDHNRRMSFRVLGAGVQGRDVALAGLLSMGESWHNNHHAYPGSAKIGLSDDQPDPGWWLLLALKKVGLAWNLKLPSDLPVRQGLVTLDTDAERCGVCRSLRRLAVGRS